MPPFDEDVIQTRDVILCLFLSSHQWHKLPQRIILVRPEVCWLWAASKQRPLSRRICHLHVHPNKLYFSTRGAGSCTYDIR